MCDKGSIKGAFTYYIIKNMGLLPPLPPVSSLVIIGHPPPPVITSSFRSTPTHPSASVILYMCKCNISKAFFLWWLPLKRGAVGGCQLSLIPYYFFNISLIPYFFPHFIPYPLFFLAFIPYPLWFFLAFIPYPLWFFSIYPLSLMATAPLSESFS